MATDLSAAESEKIELERIRDMAAAAIVLVESALESLRTAAEETESSYKARRAVGVAHNLTNAATRALDVV